MLKPKKVPNFMQGYGLVANNTWGCFDTPLFICIIMESPISWWESMGDAPTSSIERIAVSVIPLMETNFEICICVILSSRESEVCVGSPCLESLCNGVHGFNRCAREKSIGEVVLRSWPLGISLEERMVRDGTKRTMMVVMFPLAWVHPIRPIGDICHPTTRHHHWWYCFGIHSPSGVEMVV